MSYLKKYITAGKYRFVMLFAGIDGVEVSFSPVDEGS